MSMSSSSFACALWLALSVGCSPFSSPDDEHGYELRLRAELPDATPLSGARFWIAGRQLAPTAPDGRATTTIRGREGDVLEISLLCPAGSRGSEEPRALRLPKADGSRAPNPLVLALRCTPERARAALVVRARHHGAPVALPILVDGRVVGQTEDDGVTHVLLHAAPAASMQVQLDTSLRADLSPKNPVRVFDLEPGESILLFDQTFETAAPTRSAKTSTRRPRPPRPRVPYRIE